MPGDQPTPEPQLRQDIEAGQTAYTAGRDQYVTISSAASPPQPAVPPRIWGDVPHRNPGFTGREELLGAVRSALVSGDRAVVQALRGMGGVGKTQLAIEYAHRFSANYDITWWIGAEQPELIVTQFAALGAALGCVQPDAEDTAVRRTVLSELSQRERWLLVFDNAVDPEHIMAWLPTGGSGHILITSRTVVGWEDTAGRVEVDVLKRGESVLMLRSRVRGIDEADAGQVAAAVGDLPLALAQAAAYLAGTGRPAVEYVTMVKERAAEILSEGRPPSYPLPLAAVTQLSLDRLEADSPAAAQAVRICAFLAPEPVPAEWFINAAGQLPGPLPSAAADPLAWGRVLARVSEQGLARTSPQGLLMHRLTQAIIRTAMSPPEAAATWDAAAILLTANRPGDSGSPSSWPGWARLLPHLLAQDPAVVEELGGLADQAIWYLVNRGLGGNALDFADRLYQHRLRQEGPDGVRTLKAAHTLSAVLTDARRYADSRQLARDTLARRKRVLGEDHPDTLHSAANLAAILAWLGEFRAALELDEDTLARRKRVLGEDHPNTLHSASNLAVDLRNLGEYEAARELSEDTFARRKLVLGDDDPETLHTAGNLAADLYELGDYWAARELSEDTFARRKRVLGEDHPNTLHSASSLATILAYLGERQAARELDEDTLARRKRVLGENHPDTLRSASDLAFDLNNLGEHQAALELDEDTLARRLRVLGEDHPDTLRSKSNVAATKHEMSELSDGPAA